MITAPLATIKKQGSDEPLVVKVTLETGADLGSLGAVFWMDRSNGTPKVEGQVADVEDITPLDAEPLTVWRITYRWDDGDLDEIGTFRAEFEIDYGASGSRYYPAGDSTIAVQVVRHPATDGA